MAEYNINNVKFSGIKQPNIRFSNKVAANKYDIDENDNIIANSPVINAIDIDWNNAQTDNIGPISTTADIINTIDEVKTSIPNSVYDLQGSGNLLTIDDVNSLKPQLRGLSAYEIAKQAYENEYSTQFPYTESQWIDSLKGDQGERGLPGLNGTSAYESAKSYYRINNIEFPYSSEMEWIQAIISGNDTKQYTDEKINDLHTSLMTTVNQTIDTRVNDIIDGASEAFDTFKEVENWINELNINPAEVQNNLQNLREELTNLKGNLNETIIEIDDQGNETFIVKPKTYDKTGTEYGNSLEKINDIINDILTNMSTAKDVQDGAESNVIDAIIGETQEFTVNNNNVIDKYINVEKVEGSKTITLSVNKELMNNINNDIVSKAYNQSKTYIDNKLSWKKI